MRWAGKYETGVVGVAGVAAGGAERSNEDLRKMEPPKMGSADMREKRAD